MTSRCTFLRSTGGQRPQEREALPFDGFRRRRHRPCRSPCAGVALVLRRAERHAEPAPRAVVGRDLHHVRLPRVLLAPCKSSTGTPRARRRGAGVEHHRPERRVRTDERALVALDADRRDPTTGISSAVLRFSHSRCPVGQVPSIGNALTGSRSPLPRDHRRGHRLRRSRRRPPEIGERRGPMARRGDLAPATCTSVMRWTARSTAA